MTTSPAQQRASVIRALERVWDGGPEVVLDVVPALLLRWPEAFGLASCDTTDASGADYRRVFTGTAMVDGKPVSARRSPAG